MVESNIDISKGIVLFDGDCIFCNSTVLFLIKHDKNDNLRFVSQQSEIGIKLLAEIGCQTNPLSTIVFINTNDVYIKTNALLEICQLLVGYPKLFIFLKIIPTKVRDYGYQIFSKYRYNLFGKKRDCSIPSKETRMKFLC